MLIRQPFEPDVARERLARAHGSVAQDALKGYLTWEAGDKGAFLEAAHSRIEAERIKAVRDAEARRDEIIDRHRRMVEASGGIYKVGPAKPPQPA